MTQSDAESDLAMRVGLLNLATSFRLSQALYVAARMNITSLLAGEPHSAEELATATGVHARSPTCYAPLSPSTYSMSQGLAYLHSPQ